MFEAPAHDPRVRVRRSGAPDPDGRCVVYWMNRAQRADDNPALDVAIDAGNALRKPVVVFFGLHAFVERANLRHYQFLVEGLPELAAGLQDRGVGFVLRRSPDHRLLPFLDEVRPALVVADENPLRQTEGWRQTMAAEHDRECETSKREPLAVLLVRVDLGRRAVDLHHDVRVSICPGNVTIQPRRTCARSLAERSASTGPFRRIDPNRCA